MSKKDRLIRGDTPGDYFFGRIPSGLSLASAVGGMLLFLEQLVSDAQLGFSNQSYVVWISTSALVLVLSTLFYERHVTWRHVRLCRFLVAVAAGAFVGAFLAKPEWRLALALAGAALPAIVWGILLPALAARD